MRVYLDNAATTPIAPEVAQAMIPYILNEFGNPSSTHFYGRQAKGVIEMSRRTVAKLLHCSPSEIIFTSGGTEADNMALTTAILSLGAKRIISSSIEHHAVGHTIEALVRDHGIEVVWLDVDSKGSINLQQLENYLKEPIPTIVSLMHANNEIGTLLPIKEVSSLCRQYGAWFHSDTVQTMAHYAFDLQDLDIDFITCAAHKFHGPKGVGFLYVNKNVKAEAFIHGGAQERGLRGGTENLYGIVGLAKALELANTDIEEHQHHVQELKSYMMTQLEKQLPGVTFHGETDPSKSLYTVLNACLPPTEKSGMLLFTLDLRGVACSGGSACSSGSNKGSHVLEGIGADNSRPNARFSFSRYTTKEEIDFALEQLVSIYAK
ncbi:MAG: cysteine desulfurase [Candidatus Fluviicola riflensis]|nr:MAG: cysteine desulfurase [Candidatus Fluviicola riflensis]OGS75929.1 MAG: cysteine desulfurase [Candidatus Fluviicola riflensis]OGS83609.1 MAG: cysteine desulfurase [Fluviicola sp. RIFCSPHIGHO2_01_FULL_43_53]OGS85748.1 MAG: cysteine desulfurase [Fluviicola sp. RIFCSPHIGHO2_12_FULL_43_24]